MTHARFSLPVAWGILATCLLASPVRCAVADDDTPLLTFKVSAQQSGRQLVRCALPFAQGRLTSDQPIVVSDGHQRFPAAIRPLGQHAEQGNNQPTVRCALVTFAYPFAAAEPVAFEILPARDPPPPATDPAVEVQIDAPRVSLRYGNELALELQPDLPALDAQAVWTKQEVEESPFYHWQRWRAADANWAEIVEVRWDLLGQVAVVAHLQRRTPTGDYSPALGWTVKPVAVKQAAVLKGSEPAELVQSGQTARHPWTGGVPAQLALNERWRISAPSAALVRCGRMEASRDAAGTLTAACWQALPEDRVPLQHFAWRRAQLVIAPRELSELRPTLQSAHQVDIPWRAWDSAYGNGAPVDPAAPPVLLEALAFHHDATVQSAAAGLDWGTVTSFSADSPHGGWFGMDRLNHCRPIFLEAMRSGDRRLIETAVAWCDTFFDLSIWWGAERTGGTRYHDLRAMGATPPENDDRFRWRSSTAVDFCTKGFEAFLLAYEQTGDPRMQEALTAQLAYGAQQIHALRECRNIGDVADFIHLYRYLGDSAQREQALRLFRELRTRIGPDYLFSQSGDPIEADPPFIDNDASGYRHPFAKPYIIGYALNGLPELLLTAADEPALREVITAVCDFLASSQDPLGGWRYPHPASSSLLCSQAIEHAWQLVQAARVVGVTPARLDAIERVLRQRIQVWQKTGRILSGLGPWELASGKVQKADEIAALYQRPADRDASRDYELGNISLGGSPPEGIVYFAEVLSFYLQHRPADRLLAPPAADEPLGKVLVRLEATRP